MLRSQADNLPLAECGQAAKGGSGERKEGRKEGRKKGRGKMDRLVKEYGLKRE